MQGKPALPQPFPGAAEAQGFGKILAWAGDLYPWQIATVFYSDKLAADRARAVAFMKGYVRASRRLPYRGEIGPKTLGGGSANRTPDDEAAN